MNVVSQEHAGYLRRRASLSLAPCRIPKIIFRPSAPVPNAATICFPSKAACGSIRPLVDGVAEPERVFGGAASGAGCRSAVLAELERIAEQCDYRTIRLDARDITLFPVAGCKLPISDPGASRRPSRGEPVSLRSLEKLRATY